MEIRKLKPEERFEANLISTVAFHMKMEDPEKNRQDSLKDSGDEDWGAFSEDGKMMARIINNHYKTRLDGRIIPNGGIGAVSTLPEYRNTGAVREIFAKLLPEARRNGEVISTLYPFSHAFYRKFGYETVRWQNQYEFSPSVLSEYRFSGTAELWKPGDPVSEYTELYNRFADGYNLAMCRDDSMMLELIQGEYYKDRKFCYLLREGGKTVAYLVFQDIRNDPAAILAVKDLAWEGRTGLYAILGFLARFSADYGTIRMFLPSSLELLSVIHTPRAYDIQQTALQSYMIRAVNVQKLLEIIKKPEDSCFVIRVEGDMQIAENNGTWQVSGNSAVLTETAPDLTVSVQAFGQLACGSVSLSEAVYRPDVTVSGNEDILRKVFARKPILVEDHF